MLSQPHDLPLQRLDVVVDIRPTFTQRAAPRDPSPITWRIVLGRHAEGSEPIDWASLERCEPSGSIERLALQDGDVLLTTRTKNLRAVVARSVPPRVVASSQFVVLRPRPERVDPNYLAWALNRVETRGRLRALLKGSSVQFLPVADLAAFEITLPDLERQRSLARVLELRQRDAELRRRLDQALDVLMEAASRISNTN